MDLIAGNRHRKWTYGWPRSGRAAIAAAAAWLLLGLGAEAKPARTSDLFGHEPPKLRGSVPAPKIPLPRPRPAEAPAPEPERPAAAKPDTRSGKAAEPAGPAAPVPPQPSACHAALTEIAIAPSIPDIHGPGGCGGTDLVKLEAIVLPDGHHVAVTPAATLRCSMASAIADWVRTDIAPLAAKLGSEVSVLDNFDSYECRGFNGVPGAHLSEHGHANALDVRAFKLADGRTIALTDRGVSRELREAVLHSVCARFTTVLGPGSDGYHEDHIHLDLMERHNNYRICQWNVYDPLPQIAPLMPAERPEEAPPREVAAKPDDKADDKSRGKSDADKPARAEPGKADGDSSAAKPPPKKQAATKKRR